MSGFSDQEIDRARRYHRPRYVALVIDLVVSVAVLAALTQLSLPLVAAPLVVALFVSAAGLPVAWWRYRHDVAWGFATESPRAWALDRAKELLLSAGLLLLALAPLFLLARYYPRGWVWPAAAGAALLVFLLGFLAPVVMEPVFNTFQPLDDAALSQRLHALADRAGAPVRDILVADASRRTTKTNAYVSGIGRTRRVVLWDTLLGTPQDQVAVVLAHELGHRVRRHVAVLTALAMAGAAGFVLVLHAVRLHPVPRDTAFILLLALAGQLAVLPAASALSRRFERTADRFSLELTGDRPAYEALHHDLATTNLSDLQPPKWLYYWTFSHPTPPERLSDA
ncbi:MAG TPA: M48 family metalloprotease [Gaiellaceae bacterium]|jgi:STE24 endopeptidase|nr:M48 family metalloprotease [Gaiellaceae bacterium]